MCVLCVWFFIFSHFLSYYFSFLYNYSFKHRKTIYIFSYVLNFTHYFIFNIFLFSFRISFHFLMDSLIVQTFLLLNLHRFFEIFLDGQKILNFFLEFIRNRMCGMNDIFWTFFIHTYEMFLLNFLSFVNDYKTRFWGAWVGEQEDFLDALFLWRFFFFFCMIFLVFVFLNLFLY